jgi:hypothetical protein
MSQMAENPWSFTSVDVVTATPTASPNGLVASAGGAVLLTTGGAHGFVANNFITIIGATNAAYNGFYKVLDVPTATTAHLQSQALLLSGTVPAASGGGTAILNQYQFMVRMEDVYWLNANAANDEVILRSRNGALIWDAIAPTKGTYSRSKPYWTDGLTIQQISSGTVMITIN